MKILIVAPRFHTNLYYRIKALEQVGHDVRIITLYKGMAEYYENINFATIGYSKIFLYISFIFKKIQKIHLKSFWELKFAMPPLQKVEQEIVSFNPDIILLKAYQDLLSLIVLKYAKKYNKKVIIFVQTSKNNIKGSKLLLKLYLKYLEKLNVVYYISPTKKSKQALNSVGMKSIAYIPFVIKPQDISKKYFKDNKINIISVGKFVPRKDQLLLLKAINLLKNKYNIKLTLVGEKADNSYIREIYNYIKEEKLKKIVDIKFNLSYEKILEEYKYHDLFVLPSYSEPAAYSIVEAMANKLPVICSDDCGTKCYINKGTNGYIFKNMSCEDLTNKIYLIINNKKELVRMAGESFRLAQTRHLLGSFNKKFNEIVKKFN